MMGDTHTERIGLQDDFKTIMVKLSEGNPRGLTVLMQLFNKAESVDPDSALGPLTYLIDLDSFGIYGSHIWMLYKDVCKEDIVNTMAVLRAVQLGILSSGKLKRAIEDSYSKEPIIDLVEILKKVQEQLPLFNKGA